MKNFLKAWAVSLLVDLVFIGLLEWGEVEPLTKGALTVILFFLGTLISIFYASYVYRMERFL